MKSIHCVIVLYNGEEWLEKCLGSLIASSVPLNVIVVDNKSADQSVTKVKKLFPTVDLIENENNVGFGMANNIGIARALEQGADYVFLLNQDAWIEPDTISFLLETAACSPGFGIISPIHLNASGTALDRNFARCIIPSKCAGLYSDQWCGQLRKTAYEAEFVNAAAWLISRACLEKVGGFCPAFFMYGEDDNFVQRARFHGFKLGVSAASYIRHDRYDRKENKFFADRRANAIRELRVRLCNPGSNYLPIFLRKEAKEIIKSAVTLKPRSLLQSLDRLGIGLRESRRLAPLVEQMRSPGDTFLDVSRERAGPAVNGVRE